MPPVGQAASGREKRAADRSGGRGPVRRSEEAGGVGLVQGREVRRPGIDAGPRHKGRADGVGHMEMTAGALAGVEMHDAVPQAVSGVGGTLHDHMLLDDATRRRAACHLGQGRAVEHRRDQQQKGEQPAHGRQSGDERPPLQAPMFGLDIRAPEKVVTRPSRRDRKEGQGDIAGTATHDRAAHQK